MDLVNINIFFYKKISYNRHILLIKFVPSFIYPTFIPCLSYIYPTFILHLSHIFQTSRVLGLKPQLYTSCGWRPKRNATRSVGAKHLLTLAAHALRAFACGSTRSKNPDLNRSPDDRRGTRSVPWVRSTPEGVKGVRFRGVKGVRFRGVKGVRFFVKGVRFFVKGVRFFVNGVRFLMR